MTKRLAAVCALIAITTCRAAYAADLPVKAPPAAIAPAYNWTGFYIGANAGGAWGNFDPKSVASAGTYFGAGPLLNVNAIGTQSINPAGYVGGFEAGYNIQYDATVLGIEGDIEFMHLSGSRQSTGNLFGPAVFMISSAASADWLSTVRGRIGYANNNWLFFATAGAALTSLKGTFSYVDDCGAVACNPPPSGVEAPLSFSNDRLGYAVGGGVETGISANWTAKAEYLYVSFRPASATGLINAGFNGNAPIVHSIDLRTSIARMGLNYKF